MTTIVRTGQPKRADVPSESAERIATVISTVPLPDLLDADRVELDLNLSSKKSLLERAARLLADGEDGADHRDIFEALCQRERLGSTGLGHGVAIPHCRVDQPGVSGAFIRLNRPIEFDSPDGAAVDLFFVIAVPAHCSEAHLKLLSSIAEVFSDPDRRDRLRNAVDFHALTDVLEEVSGSRPAEA